MSRRTQAARGAVRWHYQHGGYGYDPAKETKQQGRWRCARAAAAAEAWAQDNASECPRHDSLRHSGAPIRGCIPCNTGVRIAWTWDEGMDWSDSPDGGAWDCGWCPPDREGRCPGHEAHCCDVYVDGEPQASLCRIVDADRNYRRVVEAELAQEALHSLAMAYAREVAVNG